MVHERKIVTLQWWEKDSYILDPWETLWSTAIIPPVLPTSRLILMRDIDLT